MANFSIKEMESILETYFNKHNVSEWKNKDYQVLSREIKKETSVLISSSTLKRIFGKRKTDDSYKPQQATINALTDYLKSINDESLNVVPQEEAINSKKVVFFLGIVAIIVFALIGYYYRAEPLENNLTPKLSLKNIEGFNTASTIFNYEIEALEDVEYKISFGDFTDTLALDPEQKSIGHFYKFPGVFRTQIHTDSKVLAETTVMVPTNDWIGLATYNNLKINNDVFPISKKTLNKSEGYLHMTSVDLHKTGIDTTNVSVLRLFNYGDFGVNGDNFRADFKLKSISFWPGVQCNSVVIKVIAENGVIQQFFTKPGCSFWMESIYSDVHKLGSKDDLSPFCIDLSQWKTIRIINSNKKLTFYQNDTVIETISYNEPLANILGVEVHFFGTGFLDHFTLQSQDGAKIFENDFNKNESL